MVGGRVHYEVFGRRKQGSAWVLEMATEDRAAAVAMAEDLLAGDRSAAAKFTKETLSGGLIWRPDRAHSPAARRTARGCSRAMAGAPSVIRSVRATTAVMR